MPAGGVWGHFSSLYIAFFLLLTLHYTACFTFKMKYLRDSMTLCKTVPCLNIYLPCCSDTLQAPQMCGVLHKSLLHKVHIASVVILHLLRLVSDGRVSKVEARQSEVRLADIEFNEA